MKLKDEFVIEEMGDEVVLIPVDSAAERFHGIARMNQTAAFLVRALKEETDEEGLLSAMREEYDGTDEAFRKSIQITLDGLRRIGALEEA